MICTCVMVEWIILDSIIIDVELASEAIVSELEKQVISSEELILKQQQEISRLHNMYCKMQSVSIDIFIIIYIWWSEV